MAQQGAGAAAGGGGDGGVGTGEQDVPDIRFLTNPKMNVKNRSKSWLEGNKNSPLCKEISMEDKERMFIGLLRTYKISEAEMTVTYQVSDEVRDQAPHILARVDRALALCQALGRKRRLALFLMILLRQSDAMRMSFPPQYRNPAQLRGDHESLEEQCETILEQILALRAGVRNAGGRLFQIPRVFKRPIQLPNAQK